MPCYAPQRRTTPAETASEPGLNMRADPQQIEQVLIDQRGGSGIGLSVSRQIIVLNRGALSVETALGRGSEFALKFR
jgi:hypothetical protein